MQLKHILFVEDATTSSSEVADEIKNLIPGCSVRKVGTRNDYIENLENAWPDLIITAFPVTGFDGITALRLRKGIAPEIPMIILGETPAENERNFLRDAGINDLIVWESPGRLKYALNDLMGIDQRKKEIDDKIKAEKGEFQLLQRILRKIPAGIYLYDPVAQTVEYSNFILAGQLGYTKEDWERFEKSFFSEVCHPHDLLDFNTRLLSFGDSSNGNIYEHELRMKHKDGSWHWMHTQNILYRKSPDQNWIFLGIVKDITLRRKLDDELTRAKLEAEKANSLKTAFLRNLSHYLRTPMNAVYGFATLMKEKELPQAVAQNYLDIIRENSENLLNLINSLIDISLLETHQILFFPEKISLNQLLRKLHDDLLISKDFSKKRFVNLKVHLWSESFSDEFYFDPKRLQQIFTNLLSNAIRHTETGSIDFGVKAVKDDWITFFVSDTGSGIPLEKQNSIFEPFHAEETGSRQETGPGLGLAICSRLISQAGGKIWFSSRPSEGTTFWFTLPRCGLQKNSEIRKHRSLMLDFDLQRIPLLIVDDNEESRLYYREVLEARGMIIYEAATMKDAWKVLLSEPSIKIVLLDIFLPDGNGLDLAIRIKKRRKDLRIIAQTAYASEEDRTKCLGAGCDDYLTKPIGREELIFRIALQMKGTERNGIFSERFAQASRNQKE